MKRRCRKNRKRYIRRNSRRRSSRRVRRNSQQHRVSGVATKILRDGGKVTVTYRGTPVTSFTDSKIELNTGGWKSNTTKTRMNQASNQFGLGYSVFQKDREWFISYKGTTKPFVGNTVSLNR